MTTGDQHIDKSTSSSLTNFESSKKMQGWFRLAETYRKSGPQPNESLRLLPNSNLNNTFVNGTSSRQQKLFEESMSSTANTNDRLLKSFEPMYSTITLDSPPNIFNSPSIISIASTPTHTLDDISCVEAESASESRLRRENISSTEIESTTSSSASTDSTQSPTRSKKFTIRKSTKPKSTVKSVEISTPITEDISDDDMPLVDIRKQIKSIDTLSIPYVHDSSIPLATDLQSLPGHIQDEIRDVRFLNYSDIDTLSMHLNTCLYLDKQSCFSSPTRQYIFKTRYNVLHKIFKIYYIKTFRKNLYLEKKTSFIKKANHKQQPLSVISSPTATSFKIDWTVNRRNSLSTHRQTPKNFFHILQTTPKTQFSLCNDSSSISKTPKENFESIKDILARTYYPHLYTAIEYGYEFGEKSKFPSTQQLISTHNDIVPIKEMPQSPDLTDDSITITLKSPPPLFTRRESTIIQQSAINAKRNELMSKSFQNGDIQSLSSIHVEHRLYDDIDELSPYTIKKSVVLLTPTKIPLTSQPLLAEKGTHLNTLRKRKSSTAISTNIIERKKKRVVSSASSESMNQIEDISEPESDEDVLPTRLPKQYFIKNGLRSNYYKTKTDNKSKSINNKNHLERPRRRQSSGSLPQFYTGIFETDDDKSPYIDYCLPYDIYWYGQKKSQQTAAINTSPPPISSLKSTTMIQHRKKKISKPKQKKPSPYKKIFRNIYTDQLRQNLLSSYNTEKAPVCDCKSSDTCEDGSCLNRMIYTECLQNCACGAKCSNQKIRKNQWFKHLEIFDTGKYGQGLRTTAPISKGTFLCEYVGEVITDDKFYERMTNIYSKDEHHYTMKLTQNLVIDAYRMGSIARFANHSCTPNCEFEKWTVDGLQRMCMFPLRSIKAGEELTYDYNFQSFNLQAQQPCYCESPKCRGKIGAKQQTTPTIIINNNHHHLTMNQKLTQRDKRMILQSSIFLLRNLRRIKTKEKLRKNNSNQLKQQTGISVFLHKIIIIPMDQIIDQL